MLISLSEIFLILDKGLCTTRSSFYTVVLYSTVLFYVRLDLRLPPCHVRFDPGPTTTGPSLFLPRLQSITLEDSNQEIENRYAFRTRHRGWTEDRDACEQSGAGLQSLVVAFPGYLHAGGGCQHVLYMSEFL